MNEGVMTLAPSPAQPSAPASEAHAVRIGLEKLLPQIVDTIDSNRAAAQERLKKHTEALSKPEPGLWRSLYNNVRSLGWEHRLKAANKACLEGFIMLDQEEIRVLGEVLQTLSAVERQDCDHVVDKVVAQDELLREQYIENGETSKARIASLEHEVRVLKDSLSHASFASSSHIAALEHEIRVLRVALSGVRPTFPLPCGVDRRHG